MKLSTLDVITLILVIVGGINWGLVAFDYNLVSAIFGSIPGAVSVIYIVVGLAALYLAVVSPKLERKQ